jgi:hypothetical protein
MHQRRRFRVLALLGGLATIAVGGSAMAPAPKGPQMVVYKTPTCGCCKKWVEHARANGFEVTVKDLSDLSEVKAELGVQPQHQSCHTALVGGYVVEGHVPADLVQKLLREKPTNIAMLAAPGMPQGSPGMEGLIKEKYDVIAVTKSGKASVYATR